MKPIHDLLLGGITLVLLLGLCIFGWYFGSTPTQTRLDAQALKRTADMKITDAQLEQYDEKGQLFKQLISTQIVHIPQDNTFLLTNPDVQVHDETSSPTLWHLTAREAQTWHGMESILFQKDVMIQQPEMPSQNAVNLKTERLTYLTKQHQATTQSGLVFDQGLTHIVADETHTRLDKDNQPTYAIAKATPPKRVHFWTQSTPAASPFHAYATQIEYFPKKHIVVLNGDAEIHQDKHRFTAPLIRYDVLRHHVLTSPKPGNKTRILFYPDKKHHA